MNMLTTFESYNIWQDHCPHSLTVEWVNRKTLAHEKRQSSPVTDAAKRLGMTWNMSVSALRKFYPGAKVDELEVEEINFALSEYKQHIDMVELYAKEYGIGVQAIVNRIHQKFSNRLFHALTEEERVSLCGPVVEYQKKKEMVCKYAAQYGITTLSLSNRLRYRHPGKRFDQITEAERVALCTVEIKKKSRVRMDRVKK